MLYEFTDDEWTAIRSLLPNEPRCAAWTTGVYATALGFAFGRTVSRSAGELGPLPQAQSVRGSVREVQQKPVRLMVMVCG